MRQELEALVGAGGRYLAGEADSDIPLADALTAARQALVPVEMDRCWAKSGVCPVCGAMWFRLHSHCPECCKPIKWVGGG